MGSLLTTDSSLPIDFELLAKNYRVANQVKIAILFIITLLGLNVATQFISQAETATGHFLVHLLASYGVVLWIVYALYSWVADANKCYSLREWDVSYKSGLLAKKIVSTPIKRIQHIEVTQGAVDRLFKLSKVVILSAGHGFVIPGLQSEIAERVRQSLLEKVKGENGE